MYNGKDFTSLPKMIVAYGNNGEIGRDNSMPWPRMKADLARFAKLTTGSVVIMGRSTYDSIHEALGQPLPNRENVVLTRNTSLEISDVKIFHSIPEVLDEYTEDERELYIIGGAKVYKDYYPMARTILATEIDIDIDDADAYFQKPTNADWSEVNRENRCSDDNNQYPFSFVEYRRTRPIVDPTKVTKRLEYADKLIKIEKSGICPFCERRFLDSSNELLEETKNWLVTRNYEPYKGSESHLLIVPKRHIEHVSELSVNGRREFIDLNVKYSENMKSGGLAMRFGDIKNTGASVAHLHSHIIETNDKTLEKPVNFRISR